MTIIAATNRPQDLDDAFRRRLEKRIYIPLPGEEGRKQLFDISLKGVELEQNIDWNCMLKSTEGYSGHDIVNVCRDAAMMGMRKKLAQVGGFDVAKIEEIKSKGQMPISNEDFKEALKNVSPSVNAADLKVYEVWMKEFGAV